MATVNIHVTVRWQGQVRRVSLVEPSSLTLQTIVTLAIQKLGGQFPLTGWWIHYEGKTLPLTQTLEEAIPEVVQLGTIVLELLGSDSPSLGTASESPLPSPPASKSPPPPPPSAMPADQPLESTLDDEDLEVESFAADRKMSRRAAAPPRMRQAAPTAMAQIEPVPATRRATVRHYERMNPQRMYPLLVIISKEEIKEIRKKYVRQTASDAFTVDEDKRAEIEPVIPGCHCYPPKCAVDIHSDVNVTFWIIPHVLGELKEPRVIIRQDGKELATIPIQMKVVRQTITIVMALMVVLLPFITTLLQHFRLDFASQMQDGFPIYAQFANFVSRSLSPEILGGLLLLLTGALYLWKRPKKRDVFWDIEPK